MTGGDSQRAGSDSGATSAACPRGCVDTDGCGCAWNAPNEPSAAETPEPKVLLLANVRISEERWDPERQQMVYRVEYDDEVESDA